MSQFETKHELATHVFTLHSVMRAGDLRGEAAANYCIKLLMMMDLLFWNSGRKIKEAVEETRECLTKNWKHYNPDGTKPFQLPMDTMDKINRLIDSFDKIMSLVSDFQVKLAVTRVDAKMHQAGVNYQERRQVTPKQVLVLGAGPHIQPPSYLSGVIDAVNSNSNNP